MSDLLARLKAGKSSTARITLSGVEFGLRILNEQDYLEAGIAAEVAMKAAGMEISYSTAELFEAEKTSQLLARALFDVASGNPVTTDVKALRQALSREESDALIVAYLAHEKTISPSERNTTEEELLVLIESLKKTPPMTNLNDLSIGTLKRLITSLVSQLPS